MNKENVKKSLLPYGVALTIAASTLTGCQEKVSYKTTTGGVIEIDGNISYDALKDATVVKIKHKKTGQENFYLCEVTEKVLDLFDTCYIYTNIENDTQTLCLNDSRESKDSNILYQEYGSVESFLLVTGNIKSDYSKEDIKEVKEAIVNGIKEEEIHKILEKTN